LPSSVGTCGFEILVSDTGIGIEASMLPALFVPYVQAKLSITRTHGGSGLGLAIVSRIVRYTSPTSTVPSCQSPVYGMSVRVSSIMGGNITVKSEVNKGSTFTVHLSLPIPRDSDTSMSIYFAHHVEPLLLMMVDIIAFEVVETPYDGEVARYPGISLARPRDCDRISPPPLKPRFVLARSLCIRGDSWLLWLTFVTVILSQQITCIITKDTSNNSWYPLFPIPFSSTTSVSCRRDDIYRCSINIIIVTIKCSYFGGG
jgi:hypothetical protein